jgi:RHS repeat-associated protein
MYKGGVFYAIHTDHLGTPRRVTDGGNVAVWQWPYNAFGNNRPVGVLSATSTTGYAITPGATPLKATLPATVVNLRYPGQYADSETGEFYNYFRQYDSRTGRYTQGDPIGLDGGWNRFAYVDGNPLLGLDPLGLANGASAQMWMKGKPFPETIAVFGCMGLMCASGGRHTDGPEFSAELTLGGGVEICSPPPPPPNTCRASDNDLLSALGVQPPGVPVPKTLGGAFFSPSMKANGQICVRLGVFGSPRFPTPSMDLGNPDKRRSQ